jgi:quinol-cytochrome oxidoreductase complex cytochrome b subunit
MALGRQIDFSAQYQPKPEWYFLWLYQFVRYFPGNAAFIGTVIIPAGAFFLLLFVPFLGGGRYGRVRVLIASMILLSSFLIFTLIPVLSQ